MVKNFLTDKNYLVFNKLGMRKYKPTRCKLHLVGLYLWL